MRLAMPCVVMEKKKKKTKEEAPNPTLCVLFGFTARIVLSVTQ